MQGLAEIQSDNSRDHGFAATVHIPNEHARLIIRTTCDKIAETVTQVSDYRNNPQRADDFAFGFVRGVFETLRENRDPATAAFAGTMLAQVNAGGIAYVRDMLRQVNGRD
jgi:hypothetical protein